MITKERREEIEKLLRSIKEREASATPGPWVRDVDVLSSNGDIEACVHDKNVSFLFTAETGLDVNQECEEGVWALAWKTQELKNADFIANSREDVPTLCSIVEELLKELND